MEEKIMDEEETLEVRSVILCDDIRRERSGKDILIGVLPGLLAVPSVPIVAPLFAFRVEFKTSALHLNDLTVEMCTPEGHVMFSSRGDVTIHNPNDPFVVSSVAGPVHFASTGIYTVRVGPKGKTKPVYTLTVVLQTAPPLPEQITRN